MRENILLNRRWKFMYGNIIQAKENKYDDGAWYDIDIPHTFSQPYFMESEFYTGFGCYRKIINIKKEWLEREIALEFKAAFQEAEIYLNGALVKTHQGGYTEFLANITGYVQEGENLLFVRLNNLWNARIAPRAGEHVFSGGIYRDVTLIITDKIHVDWYGTCVTTPAVSREKANINISTDIVNTSREAVSCKLESLIYRQDICVWKEEGMVILPPASVLAINQKGDILSPDLWHPDTPNLYKLICKVYVKEKLCDEYTTNFGIRWFAFTKDKGFFLNGEHYDIWGANIHQDHAGWGDAVTRTAISRDVRMIKDCGMNFIRGSHYPHHTFFAGECDRLGILFWSELCYWGTAGEKNDGYWTASAYPIHEEDEAGFEKNCMDTLKEMIRQNRNSPSIIIWSMGNEIFFSRDDVMDKAKALVKRLVDLTHQLDPSRPAGVGGTQRGGFDVLGDVAGYNGDGASLYIDPGIPNMVSEYGSFVADRPGEFTPNFSDNAEQNYEWRSGKALWCGFHHGSIFNDMGHMGMIDYYRLPLATWHWYRKELLRIEPPKPGIPGIPYALIMEPDKEIICADGTDDAFLTISLVDKKQNIISNPMAVTLTVTEGAGYFPTGPSITFSPGSNSFLDGRCAIEFRTYYNGINKITAAADGVKTCEIIIKGKYGEEWDNRPRKWQQGPPYLTSMPKSAAGELLSEHKPVFCSSFKKGHPSGNLTNRNEKETWLPETDGGGEWVMVDLEGSRSAGGLSLHFKEMSAVPCRVLISEDREMFTELFNLHLSEDKKTIKAHLSSCMLRYVKVIFPEKAQELEEIRLIV